VLHKLRQLWEQVDPLQLSEASPGSAELKVGSTVWIIDAASSSIFRDGRMVVSFDQVRTVDVRRDLDDEGLPERWCVVLNTGALSSLKVLVSTDDADVSIIAARLADLLGKRVRAL